jgi:hypothetical protein
VHRRQVPYLVKANTGSYSRKMPDDARRMTAREATVLRQRWTRTRILMPDETDRALAQLERALQDLERAGRILHGLSTGPWPEMKAAALELAEWARDEFGYLPDEQKAAPATGRAEPGRRARQHH